MHHHFVESSKPFLIGQPKNCTLSASATKCRCERARFQHQIKFKIPLKRFESEDKRPMPKKLFLIGVVSLGFLRECQLDEPKAIIIILWQSSLGTNSANTHSSNHSTKMQTYTHWRCWNIFDGFRSFFFFLFYFDKRQKYKIDSTPRHHGE